MAFIDFISNPEYAQQLRKNVTEDEMANSVLVTAVTQSPSRRQLFDVSKMPPNGAEWLQEADAIYLTAIAIATLAVIAVLAMTFLHLYYIYHYISNQSIQDNMYYITLLLPIMSLCSLFAMYMPRCAFFMFTICLTYLMLCLLMVIGLMKNLFGSREIFAEYLQSEGMKILMSVPPLCCCCKCCPPILPTLVNLRHLEWMVIQSPIARITIEILLIVSFLEQTGYEHFMMIGQTLEACSMLTATWACQMLIMVSQDKLQAYRFGTIFKFVNTCQVFVTLQKLIFDLIGKFHGFDSMHILGATSKALFWNNFSLTLEMCLMASLATYLVNPYRSELFDLYPKHRKHDSERPPLNQPNEDAL